MSNVQEIWMPIKGYEGLYEISNLANVKSLPKAKVSGAAGTILLKEKILTPCVNSSGYKIVVLTNSKKIKKSYFLHRLLMQHFIANPDNMPCVNHKDGNKINNSLQNLEWCSYKHNNKHARDYNLWRSGNQKPVKQICIQTGKTLNIFKSAKEAHIKTGVLRSSICCAINGKKGFKSAGGYKWQYA